MPAPGNTSLLLVPDEKEAVALSNALMAYGLAAQIYPYRDFMFHNITASHEFEHERLRVLSAIQSGSSAGRQADFVIATPDAALQYTMPPEILRENTVTLSFGEERDPEALVAFLNCLRLRSVQIRSTA